MKVFVIEEGRDEVIAMVDEAVSTASSRLAYVECRAALSRAQREGRLTRPDEGRAARILGETWPQMQVVELDDVLARRAADLTRELPLRASDAIHLASAEVIAADAREDVVFACWDRRLWDAAGTIGFVVLPLSQP